jgi:hypothetical protein
MPFFSLPFSCHFEDFLFLDSRLAAAHFHAAKRIK